MRYLGGLGFAFLVGGCADEAGYRYYRSGASQAAYEVESSQCEARVLASPIREDQQARGVALFDACMRGKGWTLVPR